MWWRVVSVWTGAAIAAFGLIGLLILIPTGVVMPASMQPGSISPAFWPKITCWILVVMGVLAALEGVWKSSAIEELPVQEGEGINGSQLSRIGSALFAFGIMFAAWTLVDLLGLPLTTSLLSVTLGLMFGERRLVRLLAVSILVPVAVFYFFTAVAGVPIPTGSILEHWIL